MVKSTKNNKELVKICRGGQTIWEILPCEIELVNTRSGDNKIVGYFFPKQGTTITVKVTELDFETYKSKVLYSDSSPTTIGNNFNVNLPFSLKRGHTVAIEVTNPNCRPIEKSISIY